MPTYTAPTRKRLATMAAREGYVLVPKGQKQEEKAVEPKSDSKGTTIAQREEARLAQMEGKDATFGQFKRINSYLTAINAHNAKKGLPLRRLWKDLDHLRAHKDMRGAAEFSAIVKRDADNLS